MSLVRKIYILLMSLIALSCVATIPIFGMESVWSGLGAISLTICLVIVWIDLTINDPYTSQVKNKKPASQKPLEKTVPYCLDTFFSQYLPNSKFINMEDPLGEGQEREKLSAKIPFKTLASLFTKINSQINTEINPTLGTTITCKLQESGRVIVEFQLQSSVTNLKEMLSEIPFHKYDMLLGRNEISDNYFTLFFPVSNPPDSLVAEIVQLEEKPLKICGHLGRLEEKVNSASVPTEHITTDTAVSAIESIGLGELIIFEYSIGTGLLQSLKSPDMIAKFKKHCILYKDKESFDRTYCNQNCIKLITTEDLPNLSIISEPSPKTNVDGVLIDDDNLAHMRWAMISKKHKGKYQSYFSAIKFKDRSHFYPNHTPLYHDSAMDSQIKGEYYSRSLKHYGFKKLYLNTFFKLDDFNRSEIFWIDEILSKTTPWQRKLKNQITEGVI